MKQYQLNRIEDKIDRLEAKVDALLEALADEAEEEDQYDLDGNLIEAIDGDDNESLD